jgi:hypothetical protein
MDRSGLVIRINIGVGHVMGWGPAAPAAAALLDAHGIPHPRRAR